MLFEVDDDLGDVFDVAELFAQGDEGAEVVFFVAEHEEGVVALEGCLEGDGELGAESGEVRCFDFDVEEEVVGGIDEEGV